MKNIIIQNGSFKKIPSLVRKFGETFAIITDEHLKSLAEELLRDMRSSGITTQLLVIPAGESHKTLETVSRLAGHLAKLELRRDAVLIGLGGGVIGDLVGFLAAIYMRGIAFISVPTTLLAMVDSSIGGKNGVDAGGGKNFIGTFRNPDLIIMDPLLLKKLPIRELKNGLAEIIKHSVIRDRKLFTYLERNRKNIEARKPNVLKKLVEWNVRIKMGIAAADPQERMKPKGISRMLLNYGHTVGHALEQLSGFSIPHGEAVSIGMAAENRIAAAKGFLKDIDARRILELIKMYGLPTKVPAEYSASALKKALGMDKKNIGGKLYFALPKGIGRAHVIAL